MARSRRRTPIMGMAAAPSEKADKQAASRRLRRIVREKLLSQPEDETLPVGHEIADQWSWAKDGKAWIGPDAPRRWLRK